jgi:hypothetical protein
MSKDVKLINNTKEYLYNENLSKSNLLINGPINVMRLEGYIGNIKKVLYIYGDYHFTNQTSCNNDLAIDIDKYFSNEFLEVKKDIDFFLEIPATAIMNHKMPMKNIYLDNVRNFFSRNFNIIPNKQVKKSESYPNIRFHYIDIRQDDKLLYLYINDLFNIII